MPVMQLVCVRSLVLVACTLPAARHAAARQLISQQPRLWLLRGLLGFASVAFIQQAVHLLAISDAVALALLSPLVVATLGTLLLRERPPPLLFLALPLASSGALLLVKPGIFSLLHGLRGDLGIATVAPLGPAAVGVAAGLAHVLSSAGAKLSVRRLAAGSTAPHHAAMIVLSAGLVSAAGAAAVCALQGTRWAWPQQALGWGLLAGVGATSFGHQVLMTAAMQRAPATRAAPLAYLSAVWGLLADFFVFGHPPSSSSLVGGTAIVAGGLLVTLGRQFGGGGGHRGSLLDTPRRLVPVQVDANTGGAILLPIATKGLLAGGADDWLRKGGEATAGTLQATLSSAWLRALTQQQQQPPPFMAVKLPAAPPPIHATDEGAAVATASAAVRVP